MDYSGTGPDSVYAEQQGAEQQGAEEQGAEEQGAEPKRRRTVSKYLFCPIEGCNFLHTNQVVINDHLSKEHEGYTFDCQHCTKQFSTSSARYKHQKEHTPPSLFCGECGKGYHYQSELDRHVGVHNTVLPFGCNKCDKRYAAKKTLDRHVKEHDDGLFQCDECPKTAPTQEKLYSHYRGAHGTGYTAPCGDWSQWPGKRARHQKKCDKCKELIKEKQQKYAASLVQNNEVKQESKPQIKIEGKPQIKIEGKPKIKSETKTKLETETEIKFEIKIEKKRKIKPETVDNNVEDKKKLKLELKRCDADD